MQGDASVTLEWGDGEHPFRLHTKRIFELQDKVGVGPEALYERIVEGTWLAQDLREIIRIGLIGGGMDALEAARLLKRYFDDTPLLKHKPVAHAILLAALVGPPDDPIEFTGKAKRGNGAGDSPSQNTSESPEQSA